MRNVHYTFLLIRKHRTALTSCYKYNEMFVKAKNKKKRRKKLESIAITPTIRAITLKRIQIFNFTSHT